VVRLLNAERLWMRLRDSTSLPKLLRRLLAQQDDP
jgi:hypothetical protein